MKKSIITPSETLSVQNSRTVTINSDKKLILYFNKLYQTWNNGNTDHIVPIVAVSLQGSILDYLFLKNNQLKDSDPLAKQILAGLKFFITKFFLYEVLPARTDAATGISICLQGLNPQFLSENLAGFYALLNATNGIINGTQINGDVKSFITYILNISSIKDHSKQLKLRKNIRGENLIEFYSRVNFEQKYAKNPKPLPTLPRQVDSLTSIEGAASGMNLESSSSSSSSSSLSSISHTNSSSNVKDLTRRFSEVKIDNNLKDLPKVNLSIGMNKFYQRRQTISHIRFNFNPPSLQPSTLVRAKSQDNNNSESIVHPTLDRPFISNRKKRGKPQHLSFSNPLAPTYSGL